MMHRIRDTFENCEYSFSGKGCKAHGVWGYLFKMIYDFRDTFQIFPGTRDIGDQPPVRMFLRAFAIRQSGKYTFTWAGSHVSLKLISNTIGLLIVVMSTEFRRDSLGFRGNILKMVGSDLETMAIMILQSTVVL